MGFTSSMPTGSTTRFPQPFSSATAVVAFATPLGYCLIEPPVLVPVGVLVVLLGGRLQHRDGRRSLWETVLAALALAGAGLLVTLAGLPSPTLDVSQLFELTAAAVMVNGLMTRQLTMDTLAGAGCAVAFAVLALKAVQTGQPVWWLLATVPVVAQSMDTSALLSREHALSTIRRLLELPRLVATRRTNPADMEPFAEDLRRILHADQLWLQMDLPTGTIWIGTSATLTAHYGRRPESLDGLEELLGSDHLARPWRMPRRMLPDGWKAGLYLPLRASDGRMAGHLLLGWTRPYGRYFVARLSRGPLSGALTNIACALGAFWTDVWAAHDLDLERARLNTVVDHSAVGILALDPDGRTVIWNTTMADLVGVPTEHALGRPAAELFALTAEDGSPVCLAHGPHGSLQLTTATGRSLWVEVSSKPWGEHSTGVLSAVFVDRTAQRQLDHMRHLLLSSVRHELLGPLTTIHGHAQLLDAVVPDDEAASLEAIHDAVETMQSVIEDMLIIVDGPPHGWLTAVPEPVDVVRLLRKTLRAVPRAAARTVVDAPPELTVRADPVRLRQCLLAVLNNAEKYAPQGTITITVDVQGPYGVIAIADKGPGIPPEERRLALQPYYRSAASRGLPGSGMGLFVTETLITAMNGSIELADTPAGGLEVRLSLLLTEGGATSAGGQIGQHRAEVR